ncbi:DUF6950 family protein [Devosia sp. A369]
MSDIIARHLRRWASTDFVWGETDCCIVLADYVLDATGRDGAAHLRGRYSSRAEAESVGGLADGHVATVGRCAALAGLDRTKAPQCGDIGILAVRNHEFAGLFLGDRWAVKSMDGVMFLARPEVLAAWAVRG